LLWSPAYTHVEGALPLDAIGKFSFRKPDSKEADIFGFVRCQLDVSSGGKLKLLLNSPAGLTLWLDQTAVEVKKEADLEVKPGLHTLSFAINLQERRDGLRCEFADAANSAARFQIVSGK
jgi:hypothetical protein